MTRIVVLGYFGYRTNQLDGQTIKTRSMYRLIREHNDETLFFDTQECRYNKVCFLKMLRLVCSCKVLIYLPAHNNLRYIFPIIWLLAKICHTRIHYFVVGGWLSGYIEHLPVHRWMLNRIEGIHSETLQLKNELVQQYQFDHVDLFPNFRFFSFTPVEHHTQGCLRLVFMARINKQKGLDMIFSLGDYIFQNALESNISIDFFGPMNDDESSEFFEAQIRSYPFMNYCGVLQPSDIYATLERYDAMLLPTHYYTEGLPGSIIDAYIAGIPVVVTNWAYAKEFVDDGLCGLIVPFENGQKEFNEAVRFLLEDESKLHMMKENARKRSRQFSAETAWSQMQQIFV